MLKIILEEFVKIVNIVVESYCLTLMLAVMVTVQRGYLAVTNVAAMINDRWPAIILSAERMYLESYLDHICWEVKNPI